MNKRIDNYDANDDDELINREDIWHFYAYFAEESAGILHEFLEICDIPKESSDLLKYMLPGIPPSESFGSNAFDAIMKAFAMLIEHFKKGSLILNGQEINLEWGDSVRSLTEGLHLFMNVLPYLNLRHYDLSKERYDQKKYHNYSFEELQHLGRTLAKRIFPTFSWFASHTIFTPKYFVRMYEYPRPINHKSTLLTSSRQWHKALKSMLKSWHWLKDCAPKDQKVELEDIPDDIYYGLHLFAEYLPEMRND